MDYEVILSLLALVALQSIPGTDNGSFISLSTDRLDSARKKTARAIGIIIATAFRIGLFFIADIFLRSGRTLFSVNEFSLSFKSITLIAGGVFLIYTGTKEIYRRLEPGKQNAKKNGVVSFVKVLLQIIAIDLLYSAESVVTAIGLAQEAWVMYAGVSAGILLMITASLKINRFPKVHPSLKALSFCFILLVGFSLICEGFEIDVPKGYIYFIMMSAIVIDLIQVRLKSGKIRPAH